MKTFVVIACLRGIVSPPVPLDPAGQAAANYRADADDSSRSQWRARWVFSRPEEPQWRPARIRPGDEAPCVVDRMLELAAGKVHHVA